MARFQPDARVAVRPFAHNQEGQDVTIGDLDRQVFVTIPVEGLGILSALAEGKTVGETERLYEQAHDETPDIEDFLTALAQEGFVAPWEDEHSRPGVEPTPAPVFRWISPAVARRLFGAPVLGACAIVVGVGLGLVATDPNLVPGSAVLVFHHHLAALSWALFAFTLVGVLVHEAGHLLAARAAGVPARIGLGNRLWILVAETDMTGIWMAPRRGRYIAFLAGPIIDAVSAAVLVGVLWAQRRGWFSLSPVLEQFTGAALMTYLLRLLWQCFVFVRTDFYYVLSTALHCKNLLADTENLLRNCLARMRGLAAVVDQSAIPPQEMRTIRAYSVIWLVGRLLALASLIFIALPVLGGYGGEIARTVTGGHPSYSTLDLLTVAVLAFGLEGGGLVVWIAGLYRARKQRKQNDVATH